MLHCAVQCRLARRVDRQTDGVAYRCASAWPIFLWSTLFLQLGRNLYEFAVEILTHYKIPTGAWIIVFQSFEKTWNYSGTKIPMRLQKVYGSNVYVFCCFWI